MISYSTISLPKDLYDQLQILVEKKPYMGYSSVADFCKEAIRLHVQEIKKELRDDFLRKIDVPLLLKKIERLSSIDAGKYGEIFENMKCMAVMFSNDYKIKECNYEFYSNLGFNSRDELIGKKIGSIFPYIDFKEQLSKKIFSDYETQALRKDGKYIDVLLSISNINKNLHIAVSKDVTIKNYLIEKQSKSRELYEYLINEICHAVIVIQDKKIKFVNSGISVTGWLKDEVLGKPFIDFIDESDKKLVNYRYKKRMEGETIGNIFTYKYRTKDNKIMEGETSSRIIDFYNQPALLVSIRFNTC